MSNNIHGLQAEKQNKVNVLLKECGVFFAFSNEQFEANKTPLQDGEKYVSIGAGGYIPKSKVDALTNGMAEINKWFKSATNKSKADREALILYALNNHECFYTGDWSDAFMTLGEGYTSKEVKRVYLKNLQHQEF